jgi:hypothetical protein
MMEALAPGLIRFRIHSPHNTVGTTDEDVSASVFASKLATLVRALKAADKAANQGAAVHEYRIRKLQSSSPTVLLAETQISKAMAVFGQSGIDAFEDCANAITVGDLDRAKQYGSCALQISKLAKGADKTFGYAEVWTANDNIIRVDPFLVEQAKMVVEPDRSAALVSASEWYKGAAHGTFIGTILQVDLRGALPEVKLVLSAGGKQIDCVCRANDVEIIRSTLNRRVRVSGTAIYDGKTGLPRRIRVSDIQPIDGAGDFSRWSGAFEPFEPTLWESDH